MKRRITGVRNSFGKLVFPVFCLVIMGGCEKPTMDLNGEFCYSMNKKTEDMVMVIHTEFPSPIFHGTLLKWYSLISEPNIGIISESNQASFTAHYVYPSEEINQTCDALFQGKDVDGDNKADYLMVLEMKCDPDWGEEEEFVGKPLLNTEKWFCTM